MSHSSYATTSLSQTRNFPIAERVQVNLLHLLPLCRGQQGRHLLQQVGWRKQRKILCAQSVLQCVCVINILAHKMHNHAQCQNILLAVRQRNVELQQVIFPIIQVLFAHILKIANRHLQKIQLHCFSCHRIVVQELIVADLATVTLINFLVSCAHWPAPSLSLFFSSADRHNLNAALAGSGFLGCLQRNGFFQIAIQHIVQCFNHGTAVQLVCFQHLLCADTDAVAHPLAHLGHLLADLIRGPLKYLVKVLRGQRILVVTFHTQLAQYVGVLNQNPVITEKPRLAATHYKQLGVVHLLHLAKLGPLNGVAGVAGRSIKQVAMGAVLAFHHGLIGNLRSCQNIPPKYSLYKKEPRLAAGVSFSSKPYQANL
nr:MAG TPA: hypothetical protein [Caudoviricetes sp.]